jgi:hypothetical protein
MLRAANRAWINFNRRLHSKTSEEITWLLNESDTLSNKRNEAMHTPLNILMDTTSFEFKVESNHIWGHPKAIKLKDKDVLNVFSLYRAQTDCLNTYAMSIWLHLRTASPLPQRPILPTSGQCPTHKLQRRQARPK